MSFITDYSAIIAYLENKIGDLDSLSSSDAALVTAMAQLLQGRNQSLSNFDAVLTYLQARQDSVDNDSLIKDVTLLLGPAMYSKNVVWKSREFLINGTFLVPDNIAGNTVYVTGSGGGASGSASGVSSDVATSESGNAGCFIKRMPVQVSKGASIAVTVGAGGASVSASIPATSTAYAFANAGQASSFGTLVIPGGDANPRAGGGWRSGYVVAPPNDPLPENSISYKSGTRSQSGNAIALGSAAGAYGNGCNGVAAVGTNATGISAAANSGAAGGSSAVFNNTAGSLTATGGAGGSGRIIVEWQEFV